MANTLAVVKKEFWYNMGLTIFIVCSLGLVLIYLMWLRKKRMDAEAEAKVLALLE
jgi:hypothetical protein